MAQHSRRAAIPFFVLSVIPVLLLGWIGLTFIPEEGGVAIGIVVASAGIALAVILWNIGGTFRERGKASEEELDRLENLRICFLATPPDQIDSALLFQALFPSRSDFSSLMSTSMRKSTAIDEES